MIQCANEVVEKALADARAFSVSRGIGANFEQQLKYLEGYGGSSNRVTLYKDGRRNFYFQIERKIPEEDEWEVILEGGLIYYGKGDTGVGAPQFSVRLGNEDREEWRVNT